MTNKQLKNMLMFEGMIYAVVSLLITATLGLGLTYILYQSMNYRNVAFTVPLLPVFIEGMVVFIICMLIPWQSYRVIEKNGSIVERIRQTE